jgi:hypothetical protein
VAAAPAPERRARRGAAGRLALWAAAAALTALLVELLSAVVLFRYFAAREMPLDPTGSAAVFLVKRALHVWPFEVRQSIDVRPLYAVDEALGFTTVPGRYRVGLTTGTKTRTFTWTVVERGRRATSYAPVHRPRTIVLFGDSNVLGWGNDDEHSLGWLLQARFPDYEVVNLAQTGYGTTHAVLQYRALADRLGPDDVIVLPHADYYLPRNHGAPSWMRTLSSGLESRIAGREQLASAAYPVARAMPDGGLTIERVPMSCEASGAVCDRLDPPAAEMLASSRAIVRSFRDARARVMLAFLEGADGDPVVAYAREVGLPVVDLRLDKRSPEWDDFGRFDAHAGPVAHLGWFRKLADGLVREGLVATGTPPATAADGRPPADEHVQAGPRPAQR